MGEYKCFLVQPEDVYKIWNGVEPIIQTSLNTTQQEQGIKYITSEDYKKIIEDNVVQLFVTVKDKEIKIIAITQIQFYPRFHVLRWMQCGGKELKYCHKVLSDKIEEFARMKECKYMLITGRKGLKHSLEAMGWGEMKAIHQINMIKEL